MAISEIFHVTHHAKKNHCKPIDLHADLGQIFQRKTSGSHEAISTSISKKICEFFSAVLIYWCSDWFPTVIVHNWAQRHCSQQDWTLISHNDVIFIWFKGSTYLKLPPKEFPPIFVNKVYADKATFVASIDTFLSNIVPAMSLL